MTYGRGLRRGVWGCEERPHGFWPERRGRQWWPVLSLGVQMGEAFESGALGGTEHGAARAQPSAALGPAGPPTERAGGAARAGADWTLCVDTEVTRAEAVEELQERDSQGPTPPVCEER